MTTLLLLLLHLLQGAGLPVELGPDGTIVLAPRGGESHRGRSAHGGRSAQARISDGADTDPLVEHFSSPCDISNGF